MSYRIGFLGPHSSSPKSVLNRLIDEYILKHKMFDVVGELSHHNFSTTLFKIAKEKGLQTIGFTAQMFGQFDQVDQPILVSVVEYNSSLINFCDLLVFCRNSDFVDDRIELAKQENKEIREAYVLS